MANTAATNPITVLIVDDNRGARRVVRAVLKQDPGITIIGEVENGRDAVEIAKTSRPDVVVMDIEMPVMNGIDAMAQILAAIPKTKVIIFSSNNSRSDIDRVFAVGAVGFVAKHDAPRLHAAVRTASQR